MKRKFSSVVWTAVAVNVVAMGAVFALAYGAGRWSGGLSMLDFGALPFVAGIRLWAAGLAAVLGMLTLVWIASRTLGPLDQLRAFSEHIVSEQVADEAPLPVLPETGDDFQTIAEQLQVAADRLKDAAAEQQRLRALEDRIAAFAEEARTISQGDLALRIAESDGPLGEAFASVNASLDMIARVLDSARALAENGAAGAQQATSIGQQVSKSLVQQQTEIDAATAAFDVLPPSIKQVHDSSDALARAAQSAGTASDQARQAAGAVAGDIDRLQGSLRSAGELLAGLRQAAEQATSRLRALSAVTERANLLALNAAIEAARAGQAGRTSWVFAEQFRDLAQQSNSASAELDALLSSMQRDGVAATDAMELNGELARTAAKGAARVALSAEGASNSLSEALARADVISLAVARQADAARAVSSALQSTSDYEQLAAQQARQATAAAQELEKLHAELQSALGVLRSAPKPDATVKAKAATNSEI